MTLSIYCSGSIMKGASDERKLVWSDMERDQVQEGAAPHHVVFLNPDDEITDASNTLGQFGRDMYQVMVATAVVVDARERRGLGIGIEMAAAATFGTPIIVVAPRNSKYRADQLSYRGVTVRDYVHPHVASLAAKVVDDFVSAGEVLATLPEKRSRNGFVPEWLNRAVLEYRNNILNGDRPMLEALGQLEGVVGKLLRDDPSRRWDSDVAPLGLAGNEDYDPRYSE